jgi:hypothetical protein
MGCGLPVVVHKVQEEDPIDGIRYVLRRPGYSMGVRIDLDTTKIAMIDEPGPTIDPNDAGLVDMGKTKWIAAREVTEKGRVCLPVNPELTLLLAQNTKGQTETYEVRSRPWWNVAHWFADSEFAVTVDDDLALSAFTAGETDKSLEFIQAVLSISTSKGVLAAMKDTSGSTIIAMLEPNEITAAVKNVRKRECLLFGDHAFDRYVRNHVGLDARKTNLLKEIAELEKGTSKSPGDKKAAAEALPLLRAELEAVQKSIKEVSYSLPKSRFRVMLDGVSVAGAKISAGVWVTATLSRK